MNMKQAMLIVTLGFSSGAFAADPGFYVGGGGGHARHSGGLVGQIEDALARSTGYELLSADLVDDSDTAVASRYHMRVISIMQPSPDFLVDGYYDLEAWGISAFYEWEFSPTFSASMRAGMFNASQDYFQRNTTIYEYPDFSHSSDDTVPGFGLGLHWRVTPSVDLRLDHDRYQGIGKRFGFDAEDTNGRFDVGVTSLNLAVRFGR